MAKINDLRSAIEALKQYPGQLVETNVEADPKAEISGIYPSPATDRRMSAGSNRAFTGFFQASARQRRSGVRS